MRTALAILFSLLLVGCDQRKPAISEENALAQALDAHLEQIRANNPGIKKECLEKLRTNEIGAVEWMDNPDCFEMLPPQRWSGLWNSGWEWTSFCPDPAKHCPIRADHGDIWLQFAGDPNGAPPHGLYHLEFIGRRTGAVGRFGHLNQYDHLITVDRLISIRRIPDPAGDKFRH